jgi:hypothetical protein
MKKSLVSFCALFFMAFLLMANSHESKNPLVGSWEFNIPQAPWEYSKGKIVIDLNQEGLPAGKIVFESGYELTMAKIIQEDEKVIFESYIQGYSIRTIVGIEDDIMKGYTETPDGNIPFLAKREVQES